MELVKELSWLFRSEMNLVSGFASGQKKLLVKGLGKNEVEHILLHVVGK